MGTEDLTAHWEGGEINAPLHEQQLVVCNWNRPSMLLTVTGTSGTVIWCGKTWNLPADSGEEREVCATSITGADTGHKLRWGGFGVGRYKNSDVYTGYYGTYTYYRAGNSLLLSATIDGSSTSIGRDQFLKNICFGPTYTYSTCDLSIACGNHIPTASDYTIPSAWLNNSYTHAGITFSWSKGSQQWNYY